MAAGRGRPSGPSTLNKSDEIRKFYAQNPEASVRDVMDSLAKNGIEVSAPLVSGVRRNLGMPSVRRNNRKAVSGEEIVNLKQKINDLDLTPESLDEILASIEDLGSITRVREIISTLNQIDSSTTIEEEEEIDDEIENSSDEDEEEDDDDDEDEDEDEDEDDDDW